MTLQNISIAREKSSKVSETQKSLCKQQWDSWLFLKGAHLPGL